MKKFYYSLITCCLNFLFMPNVFAQVPSIFQKYTVRGSLETTHSAFNTVALICNSVAFKALILPFWGLSVFLIIGGFLLGFLKRGEKEGTSGIIYNFIMLIVGSLIVISFIFKHSDFLIMDEKVNESKVVADMPDIICVVAGGMNFLKEGFLDIIEGNALYTEFSYDENKNGDMYELVLNAFKSPVTVTDEMNFELRTFINECVSFAIEDKIIPVEDLYYTNDYLQVFQKAVEGNRGDAFFTKDYHGNSLSCSALYTKIEQSCYNAFNAATIVINDSSKDKTKTWYTSSMKHACSSFILDTHDENNIVKLQNFLQQCSDKIEKFNNQIFQGSLSNSEFFRQKLIATILYNYMNESGMQATQFKQRVSEGNKLSGLYSTTATWLPHLQVLMFNAYIVVFPFLLLFVVTPFMKQTLSFLLGTFIFFLAWDLCDMSLYYQAINAAQNLIMAIKNQSISLGTFLTFEDSASQSFAIFGKYKLISMTTAGIFASVLTKAGNSLAHMAGRQSMSIEGASADATSFTRDVGAGKNQSNLAENIGIKRTNLETGMSAISNSSAYNKMSAIKTSQSDISRLGGGSVVTASTRSAQGKSYNNLTQTLSSEAIKNSYGSQNKTVENTSSKIAKKESEDRTNRTEQDIKAANENHQTSQSFSENKARVGSRRDMGNTQGYSYAYRELINSGKINPQEMSENQFIQQASSGTSKFDSTNSLTKQQTLTKESQQQINQMYDNAVDKNIINPQQTSREQFQTGVMAGIYSSQGYKPTSDVKLESELTQKRYEDLSNVFNAEKIAAETNNYIGDDARDAYSETKAKISELQKAGDIEGLKNFYSDLKNSNKLDKNMTFNDFLSNYTKDKTNISTGENYGKIDAHKTESPHNPGLGATNLSKGKTLDAIGANNAVNNIENETGISRTKMMETLKTFQYGNQFKTADEYFDRMTKTGINFVDSDNKLHHYQPKTKEEAALFVGAVAGAYKAGTQETTPDLANIRGQGEATQLNAKSINFFHTNQQALSESTSGQEIKKRLQGYMEVEAYNVMNGKSSEAIRQDLQQAKQNPSEAKYVQQGIILKDQSFTKEQAENIVSHSTDLTEKDISRLTGGRTSLIANFNEKGEVSYSNAHTDKSSGEISGHDRKIQTAGLGNDIVDGNAAKRIEREVLQGERGRISAKEGTLDAHVSEIARYKANIASNDVTNSSGNKFRVTAGGGLEYNVSAKAGTPKWIEVATGVGAEGGIKFKAGMTGQFDGDMATSFITKYNKNFSSIRNSYLHNIKKGNEENLSKEDISKNIQKDVQKNIADSKEQADQANGNLTKNSLDKINEVKKTATEYFENKRNEVKGNFSDNSNPSKDEKKYDILTMDKQAFKEKYGTTPSQLKNTEQLKALHNRRFGAQNTLSDSNLKKFADENGLTAMYDERIKKGNWDYTYKNNQHSRK